MIRLGPCRCQGCDRLVYWAGEGRFGSWQNGDGTPHGCGTIKRLPVTTSGLSGVTGRARASRSPRLL